ncbi:putative ABC transporter type 1, transmembrane domain superfamily [Helianthus anomalus]
MIGKHKKETNASKDGSFRSLFMHANKANMFLMAVGLIVAVGDGIGTPTMLFFTSTIMNTINRSRFFCNRQHLHTKSIRLLILDIINLVLI